MIVSHTEKSCRGLHVTLTLCNSVSEGGRDDPKEGITIMSQAPTDTTTFSHRRLPFPVLCISCGLLVVVGALLVVWLLHAIVRAHKSRDEHTAHVCRLAQRAVALLDDPKRCAASVQEARHAANAAVRDMQRFNGLPSQCDLQPPRTNDLFALQQEALNATATVEPRPVVATPVEEPSLIHYNFQHPAIELS